MIPVMPEGNTSVATLTLESGNENNHVLVGEEVPCYIGTIDEEQIQDVCLVAKRGSTNSIFPVYLSDANGFKTTFDEAFLGGHSCM